MPTPTSTWTESKVDTKNLIGARCTVLDWEKDQHGSLGDRQRFVQASEAQRTSPRSKMPNRGHSLTIDHGWQEVAQTALDFIERFVPARPS